MQNDDILKEIQKLKEVSSWTQNQLLEIEAKMQKKGQKNNHFIKTDAILNKNSNEADYPLFLKSKKFEKTELKSFEPEYHTSKFNDFEMIEELYKRSRKHLQIFQKKCDDLLNPVNSKKKLNHKQKKKNNLNQFYTNHYLDVDNNSINAISNQRNYFNNSHTLSHSKAKHCYPSFNFPINYAVSDDLSNKSSSDFYFTKEFDYDNDSSNCSKHSKSTDNYSYKDNIEFYKKCKLNFNNDDSTFDTDFSSQTNMNDYERNNFFTANTTDSIDDSDDTDFFKTIYLNGREFHNIHNNNIPYQFQNKINTGIFENQPFQTDFSNNRKHNYIFNDSSSFESSSISTVSSSLNTNSNLPDYL